MRPHIASLIHDGFTLFAVDNSRMVDGRQLRWDVIARKDPIRTNNLPGVYAYFAGERCLYVGKAANSHLVGRALDYLYVKSVGTRGHVLRVIQERATSLLIRKIDSPGEARRLELSYMVALEPVLNEGFIYATSGERDLYDLPSPK